MADKAHKLSESVPGAWYVDDTCTPCRVCLDVPLADQFLKYNDDETYVYFYKQPEGDDEINAASEAMAICPQAAIGADGE
ncbi:ferredoxin [Verrucomicrobiota bacterium sgz303538]